MFTRLRFAFSKLAMRVAIPTSAAFTFAACGSPNDEDGGLCFIEPLTMGQATSVATGCTPPSLLVLDDIPDDPALDDGDKDTLATFEVCGDVFVGKYVRNREAAEKGLLMWQEVVLRIPANQRRDLVQFEIYQNSGQAAIFNRTGDITTQRQGLKIGFHVDTFDDNQSDVCAPLAPRRGSFDWSLVHEFGHLRGWVDGSWPEFLDTFPDFEGPGEGYPEDGSPVLDRDFVTSYAERADGDEDHAESWTTFVMLPEPAIVAEDEGEPLAMTKVRWMREQPGLAELRQAIRITEADGGNVTVAPAPRLFETHRPVIDPPTELLGTWEGEVEDAGNSYTQRFVLTEGDIISVRIEDGVERERQSLRETHDSGMFVQYTQDYSEANALFFFIAEVFRGARMVDNFLFGFGPNELQWSRDGGPQGIRMIRVTP